MDYNITVLSLTRHAVSTTSQSQNGSPWSGDMWIPHQRKSSRHSPQWVKWCALSFGVGKGWSFWIYQNLDKPSTLTATPWHRWNRRLECPELDQRRWQSSVIQVWGLWSTLPILAELLCHTHYIDEIWCLLISICLVWWKMDCIGNIFLAVMLS